MKKTILYTLLFIAGVFAQKAQAQCNAQYTYTTNGTTSVNFFPVDSNPGTFFTYSWTFGDLGTSNLAQPTHSYNAFGSYQVCLTVTGGGCTTSYCDSIIVNNCPLTASIAYNIPSNSPNGIEVQYYGMTTGANPGPSGLSYYWSSTPGTVQQANSASTIVLYPPSTTSAQVCLYVVESAACSVSECINVSIPNPQPCNPAFSYSDGGSGAFWFYSLADSMNLTNTATYTWDFGDGSAPGSGQYLNHQFANSATYTVCLYVSDTANSCADTLCQSVVVNTNPILNGNAITGLVILQNSPACNAIVYLIVEDTVGYLSVVDSAIIVDSAGQCSGSFGFNGLGSGAYYVKAALTPNDANYSAYLPTYYGNELLWSNATAINFSPAIGNIVAVNIDLIPGNNIGGPGFIGGFVSQGAGKTDGVGDPIANMQINLTTMTDQAIAYAYTNAQGQFSFSNLAYGTYKVYAEEINKVPSPTIVTLNPEAQSINGIAIVVNSNSAVTGINDNNNWTVISALSPNPSTAFAQLTIKINESADYTLKVTDLMGRVINTETLHLGAGKQLLQINTAALQSGIYQVSLQHESDMSTFRLVRQ